MTAGLLFGSFNPVHFGHLLLATRVCEYASLDEIWLVVSPHNPHKHIDDLASDQHRLKMAELATDGHPYIKVCDLEYTLSRPSYTHQTLKKLSVLYPDHSFKIILGADNLEKFNTWKEADWIKENYELLVYDRVNSMSNKTSIKTIGLPLIDVSATEIRQRLSEGKPIRYFVPEAVERYIADNNLYL